MARILVIALLVLLTVTGLGWLTWHLSYGLADRHPEEAGVPGLSAAASIEWGEDGVPLIRADSRPDALAALGYAHALLRPWEMVLWRQAATGRLAEWFGEEVLRLDGATRQLGLAALAEETYRRLPASERGLLEAYSRGVNAALSDRRVRRADALVLLGLEPEPWQPWHSLAVERLMAWMATAPAPPDTAGRLEPDAARFLESDRLLRRWLHLHGFEHGMAWAVQDTAGGQRFYQRHVYGASALPLFLSAALALPSDTFYVSTIPGTVAFPAGRSDRRAWSIFLQGTATLARVPADSLTPRYERLVDREGGESLQAVYRRAGELYLSAPRTRTHRVDSLLADSTGLAVGALHVVRDSVWSLRWPGLAPGSDAPAWRALLGDTAAAAFTLIDGDGLAVSREGGVQLLGSPAFARTFPGGTLVSGSDWAEYPAQRLAFLQQSDSLRRYDLWQEDAVSPWAAAVAPGLIAAVDTMYPLPDTLRDALAFLRNWDFSYARPSIGASIFDHWVRAYEARLDTLPPGGPPLHPIVEQQVRVQTLRAAVDTLIARFGIAMGQWRWENVQPNRRLFPVWSADSLAGRVPASLARSRFAPLRVTGSGHPTTLAWGPAVFGDEPPAPSAWTAWLSTAAWDSLRVQETAPRTGGPLGRYLAENQIPPPLHLNWNALRAAAGERLRRVVLNPEPLDGRTDRAARRP